MHSGDPQWPPVIPSDSMSEDERSIGRYEVPTTAEDAGERLDRVLALRLPALSRARLQTLIRAGNVTLGGLAVHDSGRRVKAGERWLVELPPPEPAEPAPEAIALAVVWEDADLVVIDKPAGLTVHPGPGHASGTLVNALIAHCGASLSGIGGVKRPGIVHRLDKDTSGLMVVAKTDRAHHGLAAQFAAHGRDGRLERGYRAIVWGVPERARGSIEAALARSAANRTRIAVVRAGSGRHAVTHFEVLECLPAAGNAKSAKVAVGPKGPKGPKPVASLLRLTLETGRTHQVRVHLAHIGHPVLGDATYGAGFKASARQLGPEAQAALQALGRQALHAAELGFVHPVSGRRLAFTSPLPSDMARLLAALREPRGSP
jgi:23S rRNA pseudouridine1911/1915/1917 synthase